MFESRRSGLSALVACVGAALATIASTSNVLAQEPASCLSSDPAAWPKPSRPYFMMAMDTSGSMVTDVGTTSSCSGFGSTRLGHARCAYKNTILAYSGQVNFGLATFDVIQDTCTNSCTCLTSDPYCFVECDYFCYQSEINTRGFCAGCGPKPGNATTASGAFVRVPMLQDHFWSNPPDASNVPQLLQWADGACNTNTELFAIGNTPLNGMLRDMKRYFAGTWVSGDGALTYPSPLAAQDLTGTGVNGSTGCRSVNVILVTDGDETCDTQQDAVNAAADLYTNGVTVGGKTFKIRVHVINFAGGNQANTNAIAAAGGTGTSYFATNEVQLAQALSTIISSSVSPETCDNKDNNCNGCTDEGFTHYCNVGQTCCAWGNQTQRDTCLAQYTATITPANPNGDLTKLPCTTVAQQGQPASWLCFDPKETCDNVDNNCQAGVDEGVLKCGSPAHCPLAETCNGQDDDCDGLTDENVCSGCVPSPEVCDGCDNDCDGLIDEGIAAVPCGQASPANCAGQLACPQKTNPGGTIGACVGGNPYSACSNSPQTEICDSIDNDCDGIVDDGIAPTPCVPAGTPGGLVFGGNSQCQQGTQACGSNQCIGFIGPSAEVCDGIDNDCDGQVDESPFGAGQPCGTNTGECTAGVTACVNGALVCQGSVGPQPESCNGLDDDCDGQTDETPLANGPPAGMNGCWNEPGNCCSFGGLNWCPPAGATCNDNGGLTAPCNKGTLVCSGGAWICQNPKGPAPEACDSIDNDCDGQVDEGLSGAPCGTDVGECVAGTIQCTNGVSSCVGSVGPTTEVCNNLDDDCDGQTDEGVAGLGAACGNNTPPCSQGITACVAGQIICQGAVLPQNEVCDGIDNDCDGQTDEAPLTDGPAAGQDGCWTNPGNCCTFQNLQWCPPAGGTCNGNGMLTAPCNKGTLTCAGAAGWSCVGPSGPSAEICDGVDNNCDGTVDNVAQTPCVPAGTPPGLVFGGTSQCKQGTQACGACVGFIGPSTELCDGIDNDCDGQVDEGAFGSGQPCGVNQPPCVAGTTACVNGALVCQGGSQPQPEVCDGIDNDCDGVVDDAPLADGPPAGMNGCWNEPGNCCSFANLAWCPPPGANCNDKGSLTAPCIQGALACAGAAGWVCQNPKGPAPETCDGIDNDCNGSADDGNLPGVGGVCGADTGECQTGIIVCNAGVLDCDGDVPPAPEACDGLDNDCDGTIDNGIPLGGACTPVYDTNAYPGDRANPPCQPGVLQCDGAGGLLCVGGIGPSPEVCDGIDNDCDGDVDEVGAGPDGIDGSANPLPPPDGNIGEPCGVNQGICIEGQWACDNGLFVCLGGQGPGIEECDCQDNDCDGVTDNNASATCTQGKECVKGSDGCQCAEPCGNGEIKCPPGQKCEVVVSSETGDTLGSYCTVDYEAICGDCAKKTVTDANGDIECAPEGTELPGCVHPPVCACKGPAGCKDPCTGVTCEPGFACAPSGPKAGICVIDNCYNIPCQGCDKACNLGACVDNPCKDDTCPPDQVCDPSDDFTSATCEGSCAGVVCPGGEKCKNGVCAPTCDPPCANGEVCDDTQSPPKCVADQCDPNPCTDGACCDPITGACGNCPCEGVICPDGQMCQDGSCFDGAGGSGGDGGSAGNAGSGGNAGNGGSTGTGTTTTTTTPRGNRDLATGGGGCAGRPRRAERQHRLPRRPPRARGGPRRSPKATPAPLLARRSLPPRRPLLPRSRHLYGRPRRPHRQPRGGALVIAKLLSAASRLLPRALRGSAGLASSAALAGTLALATAGAVGCNTEAYCFANCDGETGGTGGATTGTAGTGDFPNTGGEGGCVFDCTGGSTNTGCQPSNGGIEICDGIDNDCNGAIDDGPDIDFTSIKTCGTCDNNCFAKLLNCEPSTIACDPGANPGSEPGTCSCGSCAQDYFDLNGDEVCEYYCVQTADDDSLCNKKDDDCDGVKDEDVDLCTSTTDCGKCGNQCVTLHGTSKCVNNGMTPCTDANTACQIEACECSGPGSCFWDLDNSYATGCEYQCDITNGGVEICDGLDNDCDGKIDGKDDLSADMAIGAVCFGDPDGVCAEPAHAGTTECQGGQVVCVGPNLLVENQVLETCDGLDNDCDGVVDDSPTDIGKPCGQSNIAPCAFGVTQCQMGAIVCTGNVDPGIETCDGIDNDCNGTIDDAPVGAGVPCGVTDTGPCALGTILCVGGSLQCTGNIDPTAETCDGVDNDCDGTVDNNVPGNGAPCGQSNTAPCSFGSMQCQNGQMACVGAVDPTPELCNNIDDDCDGIVDDSAQGTGVSCGQSNTFPCSFGTITCQGGNLVCTGAVDPQTETCDGADNDCNGAIDDNPAGAGAQCGQSNTGACSFGTLQCQAGGLVCVGAVGPKPETCNGIDDDCDGVIDNNPAGAGAQCGQTDVGPCSFGIQQCQNGALVCVGAVNPQPETCNGADDNCNGVIDDNPVNAGGTCGQSNVFPCSFGTQQCQNGALVCVGAVNPQPETCNGVDDNCDGMIDSTGGQPPSDAVGPCNVPTPPPAGATSPCMAGTKACTAGVVQCVGSTGPTSPNDTCGVDANCDGSLTNQPNLQTDVSNCGACGNNCYAGAVHSIWACNAGTCQFQGCQQGYYDLNGDGQCEYACTFISATEACNGVDDNCNGQVDENVPAPSPVSVCGVSPSAVTPECTTGVTVTCTGGSWACTFPAGVCPGGCSSNDEICDALDNDCDGIVNENVANWNKPCASDDGLPPPGDGACRTTGTFVCSGPSATTCSAVKASCNSLPGGCTEVCDGVDNDCDGLVDEGYNTKGSNAANFVKPVVTKIAASLWIYTYEASRPTATSTVPGNGNGFWTSAPTGQTIDKTRACSAPGKIPWFNVTPQEVEQTCTAMGGAVCTTAQWQTACKPNAACKWGYNPRGAQCAASFTATKYCNLGPTYDFDLGTAGDQDGLLPTGSGLLQNCWADWSNLQSNTTATNKLLDLTGNLREVVKQAAGDYRLMGGAFNTGSEDGATCDFTFYSVTQDFKFFDTGFRCCFTTDPTL
ncbi:MAG: MopE-related protein [Polyangiaceae bacterium]